MIDPTNPVVALCAAGMACDGVSDEARRLFEEAWNARRDDYDAAIAAHYVARHQPTPSLTLEWNARAVEHAERVTDDRVAQLLPSLYLNLADSLLAGGKLDEAWTMVGRAAQHLAALPDDGYRALLVRGIERLQLTIVQSRKTA